MQPYKMLLSASNLKATHQRLAILQCIDTCGHIDIDAMYEKIIEKYPTMSKATLYRNINDLLSYNILEEVKLPDKKQQYEIKKVPHIHLLCSKCESVEDLFVETKPFLESISSKSGFKINSSFFVLNGTCQECLKS